MSTIHLILGSYNSQALDLLDTDRDALYEYSYKPFLKLLYNYEDIPFTMYYSGLLIEWLEKHHSEFVDVLTEMVKRRQVELIGGAYFEPMLPMIPKQDRIGQIERLTTHIRKCFGRRPRGAWIPESIWDQRIAANLSAGGIEYAFLRDYSFHFTGGRDEPGGYWPVLTEDQGKTLVLLPIAWDLSRRLFHEEPASVVRELRAIAKRAEEGRGTPVVTLLFDGSRLGYRAEEAEVAIEWYRALLDELSRNRDWIKVGLPHRIVRSERPRERSYAPVSSLAGLMEWVGAVMPGQDGHLTTNDPWRSFRSVMELYPESARLYARMQHTHVLVNQVRGDKYRKMTARDELWRGQSHYAYWHNRTGGIYRSGLRKSTYAALIEAEKTTREQGVFIPALSRIDVDLDGEEEILFQGNEINAYVDRQGGRLFELDYLPRNWNYLDTFQRRPEPFHDEATTAAGYDSWPRSAFVDHFLKPDQTLDAFARGARSSYCDLSNIDYAIEQLDKEHNSVTFSAVCHSGDGLSLLEITKLFRFGKNRVEVEYRLRNAGMDRLEAVFASELNLSFFSMDVSKLRLNVRQGRSRTEISPDRTELEGLSDIQFQDLHNNVLLTVNPTERPDLWSFPVEAVGILWDHLHWFYQSNCAVMRWPMNLEPGDTVEMAVALKIETSRKKRS